MRLFIAIKLDDKLKKSILHVQDSFRRQGVSGSYTPSENFHITLAFIGEYGAPDAVMEAIENLKFSPFDISMDRIGCFDDLWWAGFAVNNELEMLARCVRCALKDAGIPYDSKKFKAHTTFLRRARFAAGKLTDMTIKPAGMRVTGISLMRSTHGKNGMIYTELGAVYAR